MSHRPPLLAHPLHQQQASLKRQTGITVGHEDLRDVAVTVNKPHLTRRSSSRQRPATGVSPTSWPGTARWLSEGLERGAGFLEIPFGRSDALGGNSLAARLLIALGARSALLGLCALEFGA